MSALPPAGLGDRAVRGVPWTILTYGGSKLVTLATTLVLARLLEPSDFGVLALATIAIVIFQSFRDLGLGAALIVRMDLDARGMGTVYSLMLLSGGLLTAAMVAVAPLAASAFSEPRLTGVLYGLSGTMLIGSVGWFYETLMQRELEFKRRFQANLWRNVSYAVVAIGLAAFGAGIWSLVIGQVVGVAVLAALGVLLAPYRIRPAFDRTLVPDILRTGSGFLVQSAGTFVSQQVDYIALGRVVGSAQLGYYSMAFRMAEVTTYGIADPVAKVTFPAFARMVHQGLDPTPAFGKSVRLIALIACPLGILLSAAAEPFTLVALGDRWLPMVGPLMVLGIWAAVRPIEMTTTWMLNSVGSAGAVGAVSTVMVLGLVPATFIAAESGITAVATVMLAISLLSALTGSVLLARRAKFSLLSFWLSVRPVLLACAAAWPISRVVANWTIEAGALTSLAAAVGAGGLSYLVGLWLLDRNVLRETRQQIRRIISARRT